MSDLTPGASRNLGLAITMIALTAVAIALRFYAILFLLKQKPQWADWVCILAACSFYVYCAIIINFIFNVSLFHAFDLDASLGVEEVTNLLKWAYVMEVMFGFIVTMAKISILFFYHSIFAVKASRVIQAMGVICMIWLIVFTFIIALQCTPVDAFWNEMASAEYCHNAPRILLGYELTNFFIDIVMLSIPVACISFLQMKSTRKASFLGMFLVGACVCIASVLRITAIWRPPELTSFDWSYTSIWSTLQLGLAIICGCLPTYGPLLAKLHSKFASFGAPKSHKSHPNKGALGRYGTASKDRAWLKVGGEQSAGSSETWAHGHPADDIQLIQPGAIKVDRQVDVV